MMNRKKWLFLMETVGKMFFDLGKLVFGSLVLGVMIRGTIDQSKLFVGGLIATAGLLLGGLVLAVITKE
jgi:hypothetical protein